MQLVRGLEVDDQRQPGVVQEVSRGVALREDAAGNARKQSPGGHSSDSQQDLRDYQRHAGIPIAEKKTHKAVAEGGGWREDGGWGEGCVWWGGEVGEAWVSGCVGGVGGRGKWLERMRHETFGNGVTPDALAIVGMLS